MRAGEVVSAVKVKPCTVMGCGLGRGLGCSRSSGARGEVGEGRMWTRQWLEEEKPK